MRAVCGFLLVVVGVHKPLENSGVNGREVEFAEGARDLLESSSVGFEVFIIRFEIRRFFFADESIGAHGVVGCGRAVHRGFETVAGDGHGLIGLIEKLWRDGGGVLKSSVTQSSRKACGFSPVVHGG